MITCTYQSNSESEKMLAKVAREIIGNRVLKAMIDSKPVSKSKIPRIIKQLSFK
jgi:hypothetical protein